MQRQYLAGLLLVTVLLSWGCAQKKKETHTWADLAEINEQIVKTKELSPILMGTEVTGEGEVAPPKGPRVKDLTATKDGRNPQLLKVSPSRPVTRKKAEEGILLNFDNADIYEVIRVVAETLNLNYIVDPQVKGVVNIRSGQPIPKDQLLAVFKKLLNINGLDIIPEDDHYYIYVTQTPSVQAIYSPNQIGKLKNSPKVVMQIVLLMHMSSAEALDLITPYLSDQGITYNLSDQNMIIISDFESKVADIVQILSHLDVSPLASLDMRLVRVENAPLFDLYDELSEMLTAMRVNKKEKGFDGIKIVPLERVNSLLLVSNNDYLLDNVDNWIRELDIVPTHGRDSIFFYNVRNTVASELAELVNTLIGEEKPEKTTEKKPRAGAQPAAQEREKAATSKPTVVTEKTPLSTLQFAGGPTLIADDNRNIILIRALPADYRRLAKLLEKLDNLPRQVLVEALVAEVQLSDNLEYGVEWFLKNHSLSINGTSYTQEFRSTNFSNLADPASLSGFTYSILKGTDDVRVLLNALASNTNVKILSSPQILVLNNEAASINVGDQVPIVTTEVVREGEAGALNRTIQYRDTGVILNVRPRINFNGIIILDIEQEVSTASPGQAAVGVDSPVISTRQLKTKLAVKDGQPIMMGGLIRNDTNHGDSGIPILKDIPLLGWLFKSYQRSSTKTELLVMITPYVIESEDVLQQYFKTFKEKMSELREQLTGRPQELDSQ